jgi:tetratricopeptide (TPR) repeat protein
MRAFRATAFRFLTLTAMSVGSGLTFAALARAEDAPAAGDAGQGQRIDANALLKTGQDALQSGDYDKALGVFDQLAKGIEQSTQDANTYKALQLVYTFRALAFAGLREFEASEAEYKKVLDQDATYLPALLGRGKMRLEAQATDLAMTDFQAALEQDRGNVEALFGLGKCYTLLQGFQQAIKPLTTVIAKDDKNAEAYRHRAVANAGLNKFKQAHEDIEKSIQLDPEPYETYFALGTIGLHEEKYEDAAKAMTAAIKRYKPKPDSDEPYAQGYLTKAAILVEAAKVEKDPAKKQAELKEAVADCDALLEQLGDVPTYAAAKSATEFRRGVCLRMMGQLGDAVKALTEAIKLNPDLAEAYFRRGICFFEMDEPDLALADFQNASSLAYQDPRSRLWEGFTEAKLKNYYEAIRAYGEAIAESNRYTPAYVNRGLAYMMVGDYTKALSDFNDAIRIEPTESDHYFKRGLVYEKLNKNQEAADSFTTAIKFNDKNVEAYRHGAKALEALGHNDVATEYRAKADAIAPPTQPAAK